MIFLQIEVQNNLIFFWLKELKWAHWCHNTVSILLIPKLLKSRSFDLDQSAMIVW